METNAKTTIKTHEHTPKNRNKDQNKQNHADYKNINKEYKQLYKDEELKRQKWSYWDLW